MDPDRAWEQIPPERKRESPEPADRPADRSTASAIEERGDADRLLDDDSPPDRPREADEPLPPDRTREVVEPPPIGRVEKAFPDAYRYEERPLVAKTERFLPVDRWIGDRNPGYDVAVPDRSKNCGDVSRSCEYTWRGRDTKAVSINTKAAGYVGGETLDVMDHWSPGDRVSTTFDGIQHGLEKLGPGASAVVGVDFVDGGGHWFNAFNEDGRIVAGDGQVGKSKDWPPNGSLRITEADCSAIDATFIDASGKHLTRKDLPKGITG